MTRGRGTGASPVRSAEFFEGLLEICDGGEIEGFSDLCPDYEPLVLKSQEVRSGRLVGDAVACLVGYDVIAVGGVTTV